MAFFALLGAATSAVSAVSGAASAVGGLFDGGGTAGPCPGSPPIESVRTMLDRVPSTRLNELRAAWAAVHPGRAFPTDPAELTFAAMGGSDCRATSVAGQAFQAKFFELMDAYGGGGTSLASTNGTGVQVMTDAYGVHYRRNPVTQAWEIIRDAGGRILRGAAEGAVQAGAEVASDAARPIVAERSRQAIMNALPLIAIGFAVATFLRK